MTGHKICTPLVIDSDGPLSLMESDVEEALVNFGLTGAFQSCSTDQRKRYASWIASAQRQETKDERIALMLDELAVIRKFAGIGSSSVDRVDLQSTHRQEVES
jgi:Bacteriocin-protection, YdeI or OmpD-Associated